MAKKRKEGNLQKIVAAATSSTTSTYTSEHNVHFRSTVSDETLHFNPLLENYLPFTDFLTYEDQAQPVGGTDQSSYSEVACRDTTDLYSFFNTFITMENKRSYSGEQLQNTDCQNMISITNSNLLEGRNDDDAIRSSAGVKHASGAATETSDNSLFFDWLEEEISFSSSFIPNMNSSDSPQQTQLHAISLAQPSLKSSIFFSDQHKPEINMFTDNAISGPINTTLTEDPNCYLNQSSTELLNSNIAATSSPWQHNLTALATSSSWHQNSRTAATPTLSQQSSNKKMKRKTDDAKEIMDDNDSDDSDIEGDDDDYSSSDNQSHSEYDDADDDDNKELNRTMRKFSEEYLHMEQKTRNFWFYNSQSRGPKGKRLYEPITLKDIHVLDEFEDPVIAETAGSSKQSNVKLRHGDGNDPRPDLRKLINIGAKIKKLEDKFRSISATGANKVVANKEKNKLASRICRLKKKAQHEANKLKLEGLREEHEQLINVIGNLVTSMNNRILSTAETTTINRNTNSTSNQLQPDSSGLSSRLQMLIQQNLKYMIAGHTTDYVNSQIEKVARKIANRNQPEIS